jgi:hypothetical protein
MSVADIATVATAGLAAVAAGASWATVLQTRRERLATQTPDLRLEVVEDLTSKQISVHIHNHGGPAMRIRFAVAVGGQLAYGHPAPTSTFRAGEGRVIATPIQTSGGVPAPGFVAGWNTAGRKLYVFWTDSRKQTVYTQADLITSGSTDDALMKRVLPDFNIKTMTLVRYDTTERWL